MQDARVAAPLSGRAWRRIIILAAAVSALAGGAASLAARAVATEPPTHTRDRLASFEASGCRQLLAAPKRGWICISP